MENTPKIDSFEKGYQMLQQEDSKLTQICNEENQKAWKFIEEETGLLVFKTVYKVNMPLSHAIRMTSDNKLRMQWDKDFYGFEDLGKTSEGADIRYWKIKMPMLVTNRDFLCARVSRTNFKDFDYSMVVKSIEHQAKPKTSKYVRADVRSFFYMKKIDESSTQVQVIMSVDPKGLIPKFVYNTLANGVPKKMYQDMIKGYAMFKDQIVKDEAQNIRDY